MTTRRQLLVALGTASLSPLTTLAQSKQAPVVIGWLNVGSREAAGHYLAAFKQEMTALGWKEGSGYRLEERWADGAIDRLPVLAGDLAATKPKLIVAAAAPAVTAAAKAAPTTPIVVASGDPLAAGLVSNLARPGGLITGLSSIVAQINEKHLELLLAAVPKLRRVGFLFDPSNPNHTVIMDAARRSVAQYSVEARYAETARTEEIESAISGLAKDGVQALLVMPSWLFLTERERVVKAALARGLPLIGVQDDWAQSGGLLSYGTDRVALFRRAAYYVDRVLKGAKPGDLPIEQPTKFELVVNLKTAKALGLTIPQPFLMRADRVIE